jgi:hypothetical protein
MGLLGGTEASEEAHLPHAVADTWCSLRDAVATHPRVVTACFNDVTMSVEFKTDMTFATYGQKFTALVVANDHGSRVVISGVAKRASVGGRDQACIRRVAAELLADLSARLAEGCATDAQQPLNAGTTSPASDLSVGEEIAKLALLRARGFISTDEFDEHKRRLLSGEIPGNRPLAADGIGPPRQPARVRKTARTR